MICNLFSTSSLFWVATQCIYLFICVKEQPIGTILKGQAVQDEVYSPIGRVCCRLMSFDI